MIPINPLTRNFDHVLHGKDAGSHSLRLLAASECGGRCAARLDPSEHKLGAAELNHVTWMLA